MKITPYKYCENEIINSNSGSIRIISKTRIYRDKVTKKLVIGNHGNKGYIFQCMKCNNTFDMLETYIDRGNGCPYCSGHRVLIGFNDIWTTDPKIGRMLTNSEDGYQYTSQSNKEIDFTCPFCLNNLGSHRICDVKNRGLSCKSCGDGISYPNKFMYNLLLYLGINFETEYGYEWCIFPDYKDNSIMRHGRYDFCIVKRKIIIEMDSGLGHGNNVYTNGDVDVKETIYNDVMKTKIAEENGYHIIRINCAYFGSENRFDVCVEGILNSELSAIFDLTTIPWKNIAEECLDSYMIKACNLYNDGKSSSQIAKILKMDLSTIIDYLHECTNIGLCKFEPHKNTVDNRKHRNIKPVLHEETGKIFESSKLLSLLSIDEIGIEVDDSALNNNLNTKNGVYKGNHFRRISKQEFCVLKSKYPDKTFGDYLILEEKQKAS